MLLWNVLIGITFVKNLLTMFTLFSAHGAFQGRFYYLISTHAFGPGQVFHCDKFLMIYYRLCTKYDDKSATGSGNVDRISKNVC